MELNEEKESKMEFPKDELYTDDNTVNLFLKNDNTNSPTPPKYNNITSEVRFRSRSDTAISVASTVAPPDSLTQYTIPSCLPKNMPPSPVNITGMLKATKPTKRINIDNIGGNCNNDYDIKINNNDIKNINLVIDRHILTNKMKKYEEDGYYQKVLNIKDPFIVRLNGHKFNEIFFGILRDDTINGNDKINDLSKGYFVLPFDEIYHQCMINTTCDLMKEYNAITGYTISNEIILVFNSLNKKLLFDGRICKIISILSSFCSIKLQYYLNLLICKEYNWDKNMKNYNIKLKNKIKTYKFNTIFEGRCFNIDKLNLLNYILWRSYFENRIQNIINLAKLYIGIKKYKSKILNKSITEILTMLKREKNIQYNNLDISFKYGTIIKKELYKSNNNNKIRIVSCPIPFDMTSIKSNKKLYYNLLCNKYWPQKLLDKIKSHKLLRYLYISIYIYMFLVK